MCSNIFTEHTHTTPMHADTRGHSIACPRTCISASNEHATLPKMALEFLHTRAAKLGSKPLKSASLIFWNPRMHTSARLQAHTYVHYKQRYIHVYISKGNLSIDTYVKAYQHMHLHTHNKTVATHKSSRHSKACMPFLNSVCIPCMHSV